MIRSGFGLTVLPMLKTMFALGLRMALPAAGVLLVMDVAFGLVARMVPQMQIFIVGMPAKIILGLATVALVLPLIALVVGQIIGGTTVGLDALLGASR